MKIYRSERRKVVATRSWPKFCPLSFRQSFRLVVLAGLAVVFLAGPSVAQNAEVKAPLVLHAHTLKHQPASEAMALIYELLSERGTVELQPGGNTIVIRDTFPALKRIVPVLNDFDHPPRRVRMEIQIVRAEVGPRPERPQSVLPPALTERLKQLLRYESFDLVAGAAFESIEGENVTYRVGEDYQVSFRLGTLISEERIKLRGFQLFKQLEEPERRQLIRTNVNLWQGEPMVLGLARTEASSSALMVVLSFALTEERP